ncbi:MAG: toxin-antitoxin system HicB family antitoxin [Chloroflexi bacterium]|nr:toxin-antitoxin system HicB family antitoxin [Chloroflexota bacterium]MDA1146325.1 toxin-antitoxin system HicB family antitoxin [Chloroflexota bacterium]
MDRRTFLEAPYHRHWFRDEDGGWSAEVAELDGVFASGDSLEEVASNLDEAMALWFEVEQEEGRSIPAPWGSRSHSGTLNLRLPKSLHELAARRAKIEGVSLNQYLLTAIAAHVGTSASLDAPLGTSARAAQPPEDLAQTA